MALLKTARAVVGADCGPMHLAGLLGTPGVALFGPTSARQWELTACASSARPCPARRACRSPPGFRAGLPHAAAMLTGITVDRVLAEL
jgi:ADP-heptose:LPS heptosyltransferase